MSQIRVFLADDRALVRSGLRALLAGHADIEVIGDGPCSLAAFATISAAHPDVLVCPIPSPARAAAPTLPQLRSVAGHMQLLVLADQPDAVAARRARTAGALGFLTLSASDDELLQAIRAIHRGERFVDSSVAEMIESTDQLAGGLERLSERERQVLELLIRGFTNQQAADRLSLSVKTAETYRARLSRKLQLRDRASFIRYGLEQGLLTPESLADEPQATRS